MRQVMYIGPDIKGVVRRNEVFIYTPQTVIEQVAVIYGPARSLFVPMNDIVEKKKEKNRAGSDLNLIYKMLEKNAGGKG